MNDFDERELGLYCERVGLTYDIDPLYDLIYFKRKPYTGTDMVRILDECFEVEKKRQTFTFPLSLFRRLDGSQIVRMLESQVK